jgi:hypothetical protein
MSTNISTERNQLVTVDAIFIIQSAFMDKAAGVLTANIRVKNNDVDATKHCRFHLGEVSIDENDKIRGRGGKEQDEEYAILVNTYNHSLIKLATQNL